MKVSARNALKGRVKQVVPGLVHSEVRLEVAPGVEMVAIITKSSAERLNLTSGSEIYAMVKATDVMVGIG